jgi:hypothetical protein
LNASQIIRPDFPVATNVAELALLPKPVSTLAAFEVADVFVVPAVVTAVDTLARAAWKPVVFPLFEVALLVFVADVDCFVWIAATVEDALMGISVVPEQSTTRMVKSSLKSANLPTNTMGRKQGMRLRRMVDREPFQAGTVKRRLQTLA